VHEVVVPAGQRPPESHVAAFVWIPAEHIWAAHWFAGK